MAKKPERFEINDTMDNAVKTAFVKNNLPHSIIKQHPDTTIGEITLPNLDTKIECYVLENEKRVFTNRGMQKALGIGIDKSGQLLKNFLTSNEIQNSINRPDTFINISVGFEKGISFLRKGAGGSQPNTYGYEATFFLDVCHFIQDLKVNGLLPDKYEYMYQKATIISRSFSYLGLIALIDEATGFKKETSYQELLNFFFLKEEEFSEWRLTFDREFFGIIWNVWLNKKQPANNKRAGFMGGIIRDYIYYPLAVNKLNYDKKAYGILLNELDKKKNKNANVRLHQFFNEVGREALKEHILQFKTIGLVSTNKENFKKNFNKVFKIKKETDEMFDV